MWFTGPGVYDVVWNDGNRSGHQPLSRSESDLGNRIFAFCDYRKNTFRVYLYTHGTSEYNRLTGQWAVDNMITSAELTDIKWVDFLIPENLPENPDTYFAGTEFFGLFDGMLYNHKYNRAALDLTDEDSQRVENMLEHLSSEKLREMVWVDPDMCRELRQVYFTFE